MDSRAYFGDGGKVFRDPVYGEDIRLSPWEVRIINTASFQRLRGIKQLGPCETVWHCATHTRFQHSLGTLHVTQKILDQVDDPQEPLGARRVVARLLALLHDIGHLPYGHTIEDERPVLSRRHTDRARIQELFRPELDAILGELESQLSQEGRKEIGIGITVGSEEDQRKIGSLSDLLVELITECKGETDEDEPQVPATLSLYIEIVGNTVCADLLDYLRRDAYHTGLRRQYDDRIISDLHVSDGQMYLDVFSNSASRTELLNLLHVRHSLTERVYYNTTKCWAAAMVSKSVELAALDVETLYDLRDDELLGMLDHAVEYPHRLGEEAQRPAYRGPELAALAAGAGWGPEPAMLWRRAWTGFKGKVGRDLAGAAQLARAYRKRAVFRPAFTLPGAEGLWRETLKMHFHSARAQAFRLAMEAFIATLCDLEAWQVIVSCPDPRMNRKFPNPRIGPFPEGKRYRPLDAVGDDVPDPDVRGLVDRSRDICASHRNLWRFDVIVPEDVPAEKRALVNEVCRATFRRTDGESPECNCDGLHRVAFGNATKAYRLRHGSEPRVDEIDALIGATLKDKDGQEALKPLLVDDFLALIDAAGMRRTPGDEVDERGPLFRGSA